MAPVPYRVRSRVVENADSVTLCLEPVAAGVAAPRAGRVQYALRLRGRRGGDLGQRDRAGRRHPHPHHPLGRRGQRGTVCGRTGIDAWGARAVRHQLGAGRGRRARPGDRRRRGRPGPAAAGGARCAGRPGPLRPGGADRRGARAAGLPLRRANCSLARDPRLETPPDRRRPDPGLGGGDRFRHRTVAPPDPAAGADDGFPVRT